MRYVKWSITVAVFAILAGLVWPAKGAAQTKCTRMVGQTEVEMFCAYLPAVERAPTSTRTPTPSPTPTPTPVPQQPRRHRVITAWQAAGLEARRGQEIRIGDACGLIDCKCDGTRFLIPSLCSDGDCGGRVFECTTHEAQIEMFNYYAQFCEVSPLLCSHLFVDGAILVQINSDLPAERARRYEQIMKATP